MTRVVQRELFDHVDDTLVDSGGSAALLCSIDRVASLPLLFRPRYRLPSVRSECAAPFLYSRIFSVIQSDERAALPRSR